MTNFRGILLAGAVVPMMAGLFATSAMAAPKLVNGVWMCDTNVRCPPNKIPGAAAPAKQAQPPAARAQAPQAPAARAPLAQNGVQQQKAQQQQLQQQRAQQLQQQKAQQPQKAPQAPQAGQRPTGRAANGVLLCGNLPCKNQGAPAPGGNQAQQLQQQKAQQLQQQKAMQQQKAQQLQQQKAQQLQQQKAMQQQKAQQLQQQKLQQMEQQKAMQQQKLQQMQQQKAMQQQQKLQLQQQRLQPPVGLGAGGQQRLPGGQQGLIGGQGNGQLQRPVGNGQFQQPIGAGTGPYGRPPVVGQPPMQPMPGQPVRRESGGIGAAGAAAIGLGVGVVGGYMLSNQFHGGVAEVRTHRQNFVEGNVRYVREPGRVIIREEGGPAYIRHNEVERFAVLGYQTREERDGAFTRTIYDRPGGMRIITVTDADGRLVRRIRRFPDGREVIIIDNSFRPRPARFVDQVVVLPPPPPMTIPRNRYIVDASVSDQATIYEALSAPPLTKVARRYTLDEVRYSADLRAQMRSVDINTITFATGSWEVEQSQISRLSTIAAAVNKAIEANPEEVFLIEGHTDAVGDQDDNLSLSDRRAQTVAEILTRDFNVPAENLTTQGYGETQLRVQTDGAARENRRVTLRRVTPLITGSATSGDAPSSSTPAQ